MQEERNIKEFVRVSNISELSKATKVSRPTLIKIKKGDFNVHYRAVLAVSNYMDNMFGENEED